MNFRARPSFVAAILAAGALAPVAVSATADASPAPHRKPTVASVQKQLGELALQNSQLVEKYNAARYLVGRRDLAATAAQTRAAQAESRYRTASIAFGQSVQAQYQSGSLGAAGALLDSDSGSDYIDQLDTLQMISTHDSDLVSQVASTREAARSQSATARDLLAAAKRERDGIAGKRDAVTKQMSKYRTLLDTLDAREREYYDRSTNPSVSKKSLQDLPRAASPAAQRAVRFALDQLGKPYVFGAAGPGSYDCSGLTLAAWKRGGVDLPHTAAAQYNRGKHVDMDKLTPGDLIFEYQPIDHVTIYIGDGLMVSAPTEGQPVTVVPVSRYTSDIVGATHLG